MSSDTATTLPDAATFPTVSMPVTVFLTGMLIFVIVAGFLALFFWQFLLNRLFSAWTLQRTPYADLIHVATPSENTGLDPLIIRSFPVFLYASATMKNHESECAICLSEFSDEDNVRLITVCGHGFHSNCIDLWFELHKTCPVCRCELDPGQVGSRSHHESFHNTVTITIQDISRDEENNIPTPCSSKRLMEASALRFSRSHSTGHFMVKTADVNVKIKRRNYQTGSYVSFEESPHATTSSSKRVMEPSAFRFSRSHSTGHFMVKTTGRPYQTGNRVMFDELTWNGEAAEYGMA
ncbi:unnamed protein product [Cochlearia groenlandica]